MKKITLFLAIGAMSIGQLAAQETTKEKNLKVFKFDPLPLATSTLSFGVESFNADRTRSTEIHLGIRYRKDNDDYYYEVPVGVHAEPINQFSDWKGVTGTIARRFYVPAFRDREANILNQEASQSGVYFAPSLRLDFNQNEYDRSSYQYVSYDPDGKVDKYELMTRTGKINYLGAMPSLNFGVQFTVFQYAYIDLHVGGGVRIQSTNVLEETNTGTGNNYYYQDNAITTFVIKEGVQPTGGITFGLRL